MSTGQKPHGAGRSTFELVDFNRVLEALSLTPSTVFLDLGCGRGNYAIAVAESMGPEGKVYGVDAWQEGLEELRGTGRCQGSQQHHHHSCESERAHPPRRRDGRRLLHGDRAS